MRQLYPPVEPATSMHLDVGEGHRLYVERCGSSGAIPVIFLHGGPGSGCKADHRQFFDPARYDVILFDQRGAGRSLPFGEVAHNDTALLIRDIEAIREHFGIDKWMVFGGSWGATLALAYAEMWPERVLGMVMRGTFLARQRDVDWFFKDGACRLLPAQWQRFVDAVRLPDGARLIDFLHAAVFSADEALVERTARAWEAWSGAAVMFSIDQVGEDGGGGGDVKSAITKTRIEMHYARHAYFLEEDQLLRDAGRLSRVPIAIVHGARDLTCTAEAAWVLHRAIADSKLEIVRTAGHLSSERPMIDALVRTTDEMAQLIAGDKT